MSFYVLTITGFALSMDAFAVSVSCGLGGRIQKIKDKLKLVLLFALFQGFMPTIAYFISKTMGIKTNGWAGIISFAILLTIGVHMVIESINSGERCNYKSLSFGRMIFLAFATSIDAFAAGITFYIMGINILHAALIIVTITTIVSLLGTFFGCRLNSIVKKRAEIAGGVILILIGVKFLIESIMT